MEESGAVHDAQAFVERYKRNISETFLVYFSFTRLYLSRNMIPPAPSSEEGRSGGCR